MFYNPTAPCSEEDFYARDTSNPIRIRVTFDNLKDGEKSLFHKYLEGQELTVEKEIAWPQSRTSQKYFGTNLQNTDFDIFRAAATATDRKSEYAKLRAQSRYSVFPKYTNSTEATSTLRSWEEAHPEVCLRQRDDGQFFGFKEVGEAHLERFTKFLFIPAVRDAAEDASEGRGSILSDLMDIVVRNALAGRDEILELQQETQSRYDKIVDPQNLPELQKLERELTATLRTFVQDSAVNLTWTRDNRVIIPPPRAHVRLVEDGYPSEVTNTGHGLQRAFVLTMLQQLVAVETPRPAVTSREKEAPFEGEAVEPVKSAATTLILGVEEPELYQHPNRQRHFSKVLMRLASSNPVGFAPETQVIYSTHSPLFVDVERFDQLRVLSKVQGESGKPRQTRVRFATLNEVAKVLELAEGKSLGSFTSESLRPRLQALMTPWMNEGFFANVVVLVEGEEDRAAVLGMAAALGQDFEELGVSVIPCMGKPNIDRPFAIFSQLGIATYAIWDGDFEGPKSKPEDNHSLLKLFNQPPEDWPEKITEKFACFKRNLEKTLYDEIGKEAFEKLLGDCCSRLSIIKLDYGRKNASVMQEVISMAAKIGKTSPTLKTIISRIQGLYHSNRLNNASSSA